MKYKASSYNVFQPYDNRFLAYNSITDKYLVLEPLLYELFQAGKNENNLLGLKDIHEEYFETLVQTGFIVPRNKQEYKLLREEIIKVDNDETHFNIIINPTMNCNFKCWYCYESHIKGSKMDQRNIERVYKLIDEVTSKKKLESLSISWFGGEPMLYYQQVMLPILEYGNLKARERNIEFDSDITTNGFLIDDSVAEGFKEFNLNYVQITLDGNREKHDKVRYVSKSRGSYDDILKNIGILTHNEISTNIRINFIKDTLEGINELTTDLDFLTKDQLKHLKIDFHQVWQDKTKNDLTYSEILKNIKKEFRDAGFEVSTNLISPIYNSCYADKKNEVVVNYNGDIYKCTARDFNKENSLGNIDDEGVLNWNPELNERMMAKLNNKPCQECPILPLCGSGCSEFAYDHRGEDFCVYDFDYGKKQKVVLEHFLESTETYA